jgi:photosystem II stability/assembly factor-like uncharacterized protein
MSYRLFSRSAAVGIAALALAIASAIGLAQSPAADPLIRDLRWRSIGNANLIGRISAIDALDTDFSHVVVASASGGVFKSTNAGTTWTPIFDHYGAASIGDVKINQANPDLIWVGTGEECGRNSAAWGDGIYKSADGGKTFTNVGLKDTHNIGSIALHPTDPTIVYAAAIGNIWGPSARGLYKTIDGGKTWTKLAGGLPDDGRTGAIEVVMHPRDPNTLLVAFWERYRRPWVLNSGGPNGGIFKTTDGGRTWRKLTKGLPDGSTGKIGLAIARSNPKVVMAHIEHGFQPAATAPEFKDMTKLGAGLYRSEDGGETWTFQNRYVSRPFYYQHVAISPLDDKKIYSYTIRFQTSSDGGKTLQAANGGGHCWHAMWLDPHNKNRFWVGSDGGLTLTHDGAQSYQRFENLNVTQYYIVGVDQRDPYWVCGGLQDAGSSCGPSQTRAQAIYTSDWVNTSGGDGYHAAMDPTDYRWVYTESQPGSAGGNVGRMNIETRERVSIRPQKGQNITNYEQYITPEMEKSALDRNWGPPDPPAGPGGGIGGGGGARFGAFRWNWSTPFIISPHNPRTLYLGANHLFRSVDQGQTWTIISPDLTKNEPEKTVRKSGGLTPDEDPGGGAEFHATLITIAESELEPGNIWAGTDDGNVQVTRDGGKVWTNVAANIPGLPKPDLWVSRVEASHHARGTAYVAIDGHRSSYFQPWIFKTTDYGKTWTNITSNLPDGGPVYVVREDLKNPSLLFAGTEFAVYYSANGGAAWQRLNNNLPTVAVYDLVIHPRDGDLIAATHGRGIWIMDDITPLQQLTPQVRSSEAYLFENRAATRWLAIQPQGTGGSFGFRGENPSRNAAINYYLGASATGEVTFEIADTTGAMKRTLTAAAKPGVNRLSWDMRFDPTPEQRKQFDQLQAQRQAAIQAGQIPPGGGGGGGGGGGFQGGGAMLGNPVPPGEYRVTMTCGGKSYVGKIVVRRDPMLSGTN